MPPAAKNRRNNMMAGGASCCCGSGGRQKRPRPASPSGPWSPERRDADGGGGDPVDAVTAATATATARGRTAGERTAAAKWTLQWQDDDDDDEGRGGGGGGGGGSAEATAVTTAPRLRRRRGILTVSLPSSSSKSKSSLDRRSNCGSSGSGGTSNSPPPSSPSLLLCLTGKGQIRRVSSSSSSSSSAVDGADDFTTARIDGYELQQSDGDDDDDRSCWVSFDSPIWGGSWVTIEILRRRRAAGSAEEAAAVAAAEEDQDVRVQLELLTAPIRRTGSGGEDGDGAEPIQVWEPESEGEATGGVKRKLRPTIVPPTWRDAADAILRDYYDNGRRNDESRPCSDAVVVAVDENGNGDLFTVFLVGGRGVGKSTFLRYLVNRLLSRRNGVTSDDDGGGASSSSPPPPVWLLDADCAYPRASFPGTLRLTRVGTPMLHAAPRYYDSSSAKSDGDDTGRTLFFGSTTPRTDPWRYMECIEELGDSLVRRIRRDDGNSNGKGGQPPLFLVHLPAYLHVKGLLGEQVLLALLQRMRVDHLVTIASAEKIKNRFLSLRQQQEQGALSSQEDGLSDDENGGTFSSTAVDSNVENPQLPEATKHHDIYAYNYYHVYEDDEHGSGDSTYNIVDSSLLVRAAPALSTATAALRLHWTASYFVPRIWDRVVRAATATSNGGSVVPSSGGMGGLVEALDDPECRVAKALAAQAPYAVPFESVEWGFSSLPERSQDIRNEEGMLQVMNGAIVGLLRRTSTDTRNADNHHLLQCHGVGIIRGIDRRRRIFFILTPVPPERVNVLSVGSIQLPVECTFRGVESESFAFQSAATSSEAAVLGAEPMRSRNGIVRRGLGKI